jgi:putative ABC transport system ATP-binding protein
MSVIELRGIRKNYGGKSAKVEILHGLDLVIENQEFVAITGPSGSGKSTMMNIIGLLDVADQGQYLLNNQPIIDVSDKILSFYRLHKIGFIFQSFNLIPSLTVLENIQLPMVYSSIHKPERRKKVTELLDYMGIADKLHAYPNQLSGGQQQRVSIARALVNNPSLILADEPTGNLDTTTGKIIMQILQSLNQQGSTIVMVTHDLSLAKQTQRVVYMQDGVITSDTRTQPPINQPLIVPQTIIEPSITPITVDTRQQQSQTTSNTQPVLSQPEIDLNTAQLKLSSTTQVIAEAQPNITEPTVIRSGIET